MTMSEMDVVQIRALLAPLWTKNRGHVLERLTNVRSALSGAEPMDDVVRSDLHALVGTLGTYGFPAGSELATTILENTRDGAVGGHPEFLPQLDELIATLSVT
jgi:HPt (histidine-containing phosphotransfer) domain-containing protein